MQNAFPSSGKPNMGDRSIFSEKVKIAGFCCIHLNFIICEKIPLLG